MPSYRLDWKGPQVRELVVAAVKDGLAEFGLRHETEAKRGLQPGRGVLTGTLRRSLHAAGTAYDFAGDDVKPSENTPERGGQTADLAEQDGKITVVVGSGMVYARRIEELYAYLQNSHNQVLPQLMPSIERAAAGRGLK